MNRVFVYGCGGHGHVVADALRQSASSKLCEFLGWLDDAHEKHAWETAPHESVTTLHEPNFWLAHGIGDNKARAALEARTLLNPRYDFGGFVRVVHSAAVVAAEAHLGDGTVVLAGAVINTRASVGRGCIVNTGVIVEHDVGVGDFVHMAPRSVLLGGVCVGDGVLVGAGAVVLPGRVIEENAVVGAGAVVTKDVRANTTVVGNPARQYRRKL